MASRVKTGQIDVSLSASGQITDIATYTGPMDVVPFSFSPPIFYINVLFDYIVLFILPSEYDTIPKLVQCIVHTYVLHDIGIPISRFYMNMYLCIYTSPNET